MFESFDRPVQCSSGHFFTTIWVPMASAKAIRFGSKRYQHCPVGKHWAMVSPLDEQSSNTEDLERAREVHDLRIP